MYTEPQSVTVNSVAKSLPRVSYGNREGIFESRTDGLRLRVTHVLGKRNRRIARLDITKTAADPLLDGVSRQYSMSVYLTIDAHTVGFSDTEVQNNAQAIIDWADVAANLQKFVAGES